MRKRYPSVARQVVLLGLCLQISSVTGQAAPLLRGYYGSAAHSLPPAATALPHLATGAQARMLGLASEPVVDEGTHTMTVQQAEPQAVIHWQDFNIGSQATVHFDQRSQSWKVLNQVVGDGYSRIYGTLSAKGQVYLLNQNGILFGPGSKVNVHTLVASSLNLDPADYLHLDPDSGRESVKFVRFAAAGREHYYRAAGAPEATVANFGDLTAAEGGGVFLLGAHVENHGTIQAPGGQVALAAGEEVELYQFRNANAAYPVSPVGTLGVESREGADGNNAGQVTNFATGRISADRGLAGMYGSFVNQEGLIRSVSALSANGNIVLRARNRVTTSPSSQTAVPISSSKERVIADAFDAGRITIEAPEGRIEHHGTIVAPAGTVTLIARDQVYLARSSVIDVSGSWAGLSGDDRVLTVKLNSKELRDAFLYKDGPLLGSTVEVDTVTGMSIADISEYLTTRPQSALERSVDGGEIVLEAFGDNSEVVVGSGALLDISGGGRFYGAGVVSDLPVRVGNRVYGLSQVPEGVPIDEVLSESSRLHSVRWGVGVSEERWQGLYYGGSVPLKRYLPAFTQGGDGGSLWIKARKVVLDGTLNAGVMRGIYQNALANPLNAAGSLMAAGRRVPVAGSLTIGDTNVTTEGTDYLTDSIVLAGRVSPLDIAPGEPLPDSDQPVRTSYLSTESLNRAGLGEILLYANTKVYIDAEADLELRNASFGGEGDEGEADLRRAAGGYFLAEAKAVEHHGRISAPGGKVSLNLGGANPGTALQEAEQWQTVLPQVFLAPTSEITVAGSRVDNSLASGNPEPVFGFTAGGTIRLQDQLAVSQGVVVAAGARLDVSGGHERTRLGRVEGADAGSLEIAGSGLILEGELRGYALEGHRGGAASLHADTVTITDTPSFLTPALVHNIPLPEERQGRLVLAGNRFQGTGFSRLTVKSSYDLEVEKGVRLAPSLSRWLPPGGQSLRSQVTPASLAVAAPRLAGETAVTLVAGRRREKAPLKQDRGRLRLAEGTEIQVAPGGAITLEAELDAIVAGSLTAPAGKIHVGSGRDILLEASARLDAGGTVLADPDSTPAGLAMNRRPLPGGRVSLAATGRVKMAPRSLVDVSGSKAVTNTVADGRGGLTQVTAASSPGAVSVVFRDAFVRDGDFVAEKALPGLPGGRLSIDKKSPDKGLSISGDVLARFLGQGFDDLSLASVKGISFEDSFTLAAGRRLTLNAPEVSGAGGTQVALAAPWLRLSNIDPGSFSSKERLIVAAGNAGSARLSLSGTFLDVEGDIALSGFDEVRLEAGGELRLYDYLYTSTLSNRWSGGLRSNSDLVLQAPVVYPANHHHPFDFTEEATGHMVVASDFLIKTPGKVSILATAAAGRRPPLTAAGGSLSIEAGDIEHHGELAAPLGTVRLAAAGDSGRVLLAPGSRISTRGERAALFGRLRNERWEIFDKSTTETAPTQPLKEPPPQEVTITGHEVIQNPGAEIDVSGGGALIAYQFLPGIEGSANPLARAERFVILPDLAGSRPGEAVHLDGGGGLTTGTYVKLPAEYAFLPGAMIVEKTETPMLPGQRTTTPAGYPLVAGYDTETATSLSLPLRQGYIVRPAARVLAREGRFVHQQMVAGDAGRVEINADSTILAGEITGPALAGYRGATVALSGKEIEIGKGLGQLAGFDLADFSVSLPQSIQGKMFLDTGLVQDRGVAKLKVGRADTTTNITLLPEARLSGVQEVELVTDPEHGEVTLAENAEIHGQGRSPAEQGAVTVTTGTLSGGPGSLLHASDRLQLNVQNLNTYTFQGDIQVDNSSIGISSGVIYLEPTTGYTGERGNGFYISNRLRQRFAALKNLVLDPQGDLVFLGNAELQVKGDLTVDAARVTVHTEKSLDPGWGPPQEYPYQVRLEAGGRLLLGNSGGDPAGDQDFNWNSIELAADTITFGSGSVVFDNFKSVSFASRKETVFAGRGGLRADLPASGRLRFEASRFLTTMEPKTLSDLEGEGLFFEAADYLVDSADARLSFGGNGGASSGVMALPGRLSLEGESLLLERARFELPGGTFTARMSGDVELRQTSLAARGGELPFSLTVGANRYQNLFTLAGGRLILKSVAGGLVIDGGSTLDVAATQEQEGGEIRLAAAEGGVTLAGSIRGDGGLGGSFQMDSNRVDDFGNLARRLAAGGFSGRISLRAREGDVLIHYADSVATSDFKLVADQGNVDIWGRLDASATGKGGSVEILAGGDINLRTTAQILARGRGQDADGGSVFLASRSGVVNSFALPPEFGATSSLIDVSGSGRGRGGSVVYRMARTAMLGPGGGLLPQLDGQILGAATARVQAVEQYQDNFLSAYDLSRSTYQRINGRWQRVYTGILPEAESFMASMAAVWPQGGLGLAPEIEVWSSGDLILGSGFASLADSRFNGAPAVLTLRAAGNLTINGDVIDSPADKLSAMTVKMPENDGYVDSWGLALVAGADLDSADFMAVRPGEELQGKGDLAVKGQIFTESGPVRFASARDTVIGPAKVAAGYMPGTNFYTLASFDGSVSGYVGRDLVMDQGGVIETGLGDIRLRVERDVLLGAKGSETTRGAVRTVGRLPAREELPDWLQEFMTMPVEDFPASLRMAIRAGREQFVNPLWEARYWDYRQGGDVFLSAGRDILGYVNRSGTGWMARYNEQALLGFDEQEWMIQANTQYWAANYTGHSGATQGVAALANGSVRIKAGGDFYGQAATFGEGDLIIETGGNLNGRFLNSNGRAELTSKESFGTFYGALLSGDPGVVELADSRFQLRALGNIELGMVRNSTFAAGDLDYELLRTQGFSSDIDVSYDFANLTYDGDSSFQVHAALGDVLVDGEPALMPENVAAERGRLLPPTMELTAGRDIRLNNDFVMAPAARGELALLAGRDISGEYFAVEYQNGSLLMSDLDPSVVYGLQQHPAVLDFRYSTADQPAAHAQDVLHRGDPEPVTVRAGRDLRHLKLHLPKRAEIVVGRDIREINYKGQHLGAGDASLVAAGGRIDQQLSAGFTDEPLTMEQAGPGFLLIQAGSDVNLGRSQGISTVGDRYNKSLNQQLDGMGKAKGSDLAVIVGYDHQPNQEALHGFFASLKEKGVEYSQLMATGKEEDQNAAARLKQEMLTTVIEVFLQGKKSGRGDLRMVDSRIATVSGQDDLYILASGQLDVGTTVFDTGGTGGTLNGIMTEGGGDINVLAEGDINVNESRVVTYFGGDVFLLSNHGDINAGRGSTATVSAASSQGDNRESNGKLVPRYSVPGVGSGIRTLSYDPDGPLPLTAPEQGTAYLIAWEGVIDAGEAGIQARDVILAATKVLNAQNIGFAQSGIGVAVNNQAGPSLGALAGATTVNESGKAGIESSRQALETGKQLGQAMSRLAEQFNIKMVVVRFVGFN